MNIDPRLEAFITRCDAFASAAGIARTTLSFRLFNDGKRLTSLASGRSDVGLARLARAERELAALEGSPKGRRTT